MSVLLKEIKSKISRDAAQKLEAADYRSDTDIQTLTREDLNELFPGAENLKMRKKISQMIHKQKPVDTVLRSLKDFIPEDSLKAALNGDGVMNDYLVILKDMKAQVDNVQAFFAAHIDLLEKYSKNEGQYGSSSSQSLPRTSNTSRQQPGKISSRQSVSRSSYSSRQQQVKCCSMICGETFGSHATLLGHVKSKGGLVLMETAMPDCQIIIVFCPISSRVDSDVEAAMSKISGSPGNKPIILVLMHHTRDAQYTVSQKSWAHRPENIVFDINVLYHEAMGLLQCQTNDQAVAQMYNKLLEHSSCEIVRSGDADSGGGGGGGGILSFFTSGRR
ncbi:uncharacterized protein ACJ7VT_022608 isoform 2-T3 [Polymixia lowei]